MSMAEQVGDSNIMYLSITGGSLVAKSEEGAEGAKKRKWEAPDGSTGEKWEKHYKNITGRITGLDFVDGKYGEQFKVTLSGIGEKVVISMGTDSRYFSDFAKKLKSIDLSKDITINTFDFEGDNKKKIIGVAIKQDGEKINSFYWNGKKTINNIPEVSKEESKKYDKDDWATFFIKIKKFLKTEVKTVILPEFTPIKKKEEEVTEEISVVDLPF